MNSLGLQYSTSDDETEEENVPHAAAQPEFLSPATITPPTSTSSLVIDNLPPSPRGDADPQIQARIARFLDVQNNKSVKSFQVNLQTKKEVANPYILNNVVDYFGIDQLETNFAPHVFDPYNLPLHEYTDKIAMEQEKFTQARLELRQQSQSTRDCIAFTNARQSNAF